jgi:RNA polymerase sigma-70 factor (ECF subfamily)
VISDTEKQRDEWVVRAAAGERAALDSLLLHFHDPLRQFIGASIALGGLAGVSHDDLLQETIIAAIRGIRGIEPRGAEAFFAWLKTIASNCHRNMIKAAKAKKRGDGQLPIIEGESSDSAATSFLNGIAGSDASPSLMLRRKEAIEAIARAITQLSPEQRQIIDLHYHSRLSVSDLAEQMGKSEQAIRTSIHRIHKLLRDTLALEFGEFSTGL